MKKKKIILVCFVLCCKIVLSQFKDAYDYFRELPFAMEKPQLPSFANKVFNILDYGAKHNDTALSTKYIVDAINDCNKKGGGKVVIPKGTWLSAPFELKSNVNLYLEKDALLQFTNNREAYPLLKQKNKNAFVVANPIYAISADNIAITGFGTIDGAGDSWRPIKKNKVSLTMWKELQTKGVISADGKIWWPSKDAMQGDDYLKSIKDLKNITEKDYLPARDFLRPHLIYFENCSNILLQGVKIQNSPKFIFYPTKCNNLTIDGVNVFNEWYAQNGDGLDISACKNVFIHNSTLSVGDDAICMKSSGTPKENESNLYNIVIANCIVYRAHGGFVIGSNTDGGMSNIFVKDCKFIGTDIGIRVKSNNGRGGAVNNIFCDNIEMKDILKEAISFDTYYDDNTAGKSKTDVKIKDKIPNFSNFHFSNITCSNAQTALYINGLPEQDVHHLYFNNINITANKGIIANYASDIDFSGFKVNTKGQKCSLQNCKNIICE